MTQALTDMRNCTCKSYTLFSNLQDFNPWSKELSEKCANQAKFTALWCRIGVDVAWQQQLRIEGIGLSVNISACDVHGIITQFAIRERKGLQRGVTRTLHFESKEYPCFFTTTEKEVKQTIIDLRKFENSLIQCPNSTNIPQIMMDCEITKSYCGYLRCDQTPEDRTLNLYDN